MAKTLSALLPFAAVFCHIVHGASLLRTESCTLACQQLALQYGNKTSMPSSPEYTLVAPENWSETAQLSPCCVFEPQTTQDVAGALKILVATRTKFAVRGGGHMPVPRAANINNGVLISLNQMTTMRLIQNNTIAQLEPGLRWGDVYNWISTYSLGVSGGRYSPVGVPGYLLGGGINFFGSQYGWSSSMISSLEVVLANSTIIDANATSNAALFWALKGGSSNYGIVTRFDIKTFPLTKIYGGTTLYNPQHLNDFVDAVAAYSVPGGGSDDIAAAINPSVQVNMTTGALTLLSLSSRVGSDPAPAAFANFSKIPTLFTDNSVRPNFAAFAAETTLPVYSARTSRQLFWATALKASQASVFLVNHTFFETIASMSELKNVTGLGLTSTPQMVTKSWIQAAKAAGGDPMGLDSEDGIILYLITSIWEDAKDDELVYEFSKRCTAAINAKAKAEDLYYPFIYINDAGESQSPFALYGNGKSLARMKQVRSQYDPQGVFQDLMPGGFKLGY